MDRLQELVRLHRMGSGGREVARLLGMSPNTERTYRLALEAAGLLAGPIADLPTLERLKAAVEDRLPRKPPPQQTSSLEAWLARIEELWKQGLGPRAIYDRLRLEDEQFRESRATLSAVKRVCVRLKRARGVRPEDVAIPVETAARAGRAGRLRVRRPALRSARRRVAEGVGLRDGARIQPAHVRDHRLRSDDGDVAARPRRGFRGAGRRGRGRRAG